MPFHLRGRADAQKGTYWRHINDLEMSPGDISHLITKLLAHSRPPFTSLFRLLLLISAMPKRKRSFAKLGPFEVGQIAALHQEGYSEAHIASQAVNQGTIKYPGP